MRTPYSKATGLGSAKSGTEHYWAQRITAALLVPLGFLFVVVLISVAGADYAHARAALANPLLAVPLAAFIVVGIMHMRIGIHVIIMDYVPSESAKAISLAVNWFVCVLIGLASIWAVARLSFGM